LPNVDETACRSFCFCAAFYSKEIPKNVIDFIYAEVGKPSLPKDLWKFGDPSATYNISTRKLHAQMSVEARISILEIKSKIDALMKNSSSDKKRKELLETRENIEKRGKEIKRPNENKAIFKFHFSPVFYRMEFMTIENLEKLLDNKEVRTAFELLETSWPKPLHMTTCGDFAYEANKVRPIGGLQLPAKMMLPAELVSKYGTSELESYSLKFKDSKTGLESVEFELEDEKTLEVSIRAAYELDDLKDMLKKSYELLSEMSRLLIRKVE